MADPYLKADAVTSLAAGQWIIANKANWQHKQQSLGLCATTIANFAVQLVLKDDPDVTPIGDGPPPGNLGEVCDSLEEIHKAMTAPRAVGIVPFLPWLPLIIEMALAALKELLGRTQ